MNQFWSILTLIFLGAIFVAVLLNAKNFSLAAGTVFTGIQGTARTLEGR